MYYPPRWSPRQAKVSRVEERPGPMRFRLADPQPPSLTPATGRRGSVHHGGGVGIGYSLHAGMVVVDGSDNARRRLELVLTSDPATGVMRHVDAGYEEAICTAASGGISVPGPFF